jgi:hypothetical protein
MRGERDSSKRDSSLAASPALPVLPLASFFSLASNVGSGGAATAKAAAEEAAAKEAAAEKAKEDEEFSLDVLRMALRRTSQQAYRLELHACALTSAAAARWN